MTICNNIKALFSILYSQQIMPSSSSTQVHKGKPHTHAHIHKHSQTQWTKFSTLLHAIPCTVPGNLQLRQNPETVWAFPYHTLIIFIQKPGRSSLQKHSTCVALISLLTVLVVLSYAIITTVHTRTPGGGRNQNRTGIFSSYQPQSTTHSEQVSH